jgi:peptidoglycan hydrolase-like protein with peptidoglycan-binding domain
VDRDLSRHDLWEESLVRSRARREAAGAARGGFELPARGLSVAALVAVTGGTVATVGVAKVTGGDASDHGASGSGARPAAVAKAPERAAPTLDAERTAAAVPSPSGAATDRVSSTAGARSAAAATVRESKPDPVPAQQHPMAAAAASGTNPEQEPAQQAEVPSADATDDSPDLKAEEPQADAERPAGGVDELQQALGVPVDGDFGPKTERALKHWQRSHGIVADGVAGPQTRDALGIGDGKVLKPERPKQDDRGGQQRSDGGGGGVRALQQALGVGADGVFGPGTEQALERWQRAHGLAADGVAGPQTREALGIGAGKVLKRRGGGHAGGGSGGDSSVVQRVVAAGNAIAGTPYVYGGGHGSFQASGYDCSGSVSYALHGGGLLSSPLDSSALMSYGLPGPGRHITVYANSGHAYMTVDGRRFDTSARSETGSRWTSTQRSPSGYVVRHPRGL